MKKLWRLVLVLVAVFAALTAFASANPATAATTRVPFNNININCDIVSQTMWVEDGILHIRDRIMEGAVDSDGDYHEGSTRMVANANIDLATGYGSYWGTLEIYPNAYPEGYWSGHWSVQVNKGKVGGIARLKGYGEIDGLLSKADLTPIPPPLLPTYAYLCNGSTPVSGAHAVGFTMNPGGE